MIAVSILSQGSLAQKLTAAFEFYDINGDGILTLDEIQNIVKVCENKITNFFIVASWHHVSKL